MKKISILAISSQKDLLKSVRDDFKSTYEVITFTNLLEGLDMMAESEFDLLLLDEDLTWFTFPEAMKKVRELSKDIITVALIEKEHETMLDEIKDAAIYDYLIKPIDKESLARIAKHAKNSIEVIKEKRSLEKKLSVKEDEYEIVGQSQPVKQLKNIIGKVAETDATVIIFGENGVGKELVARDVYMKSLRKKKAFIIINCAALTQTLMEDELFGHEKGAFTGAGGMKKGLIEEADGGTLFMDEIGDMDLKTQAKLLRVIEYGELRRVGGNKTIKVDVRFIAATNKNLEDEVKKGAFRKDLYHRLTNFPLMVPPLRDRKEDIPMLTNHFLHKICSDIHKDLHVISGQAMKYLIDYAYPGNIRELKNLIERMVILANRKIIEVGDLPLELKMRSDTLENKVVTGIGPLKEILENEVFELAEVERVVIAMALQKTRWNKQETAKLLGIGRTTLYEKIKKYELDRRGMERFRDEDDM